MALFASLVLSVAPPPAAVVEVAEALAAGCLVGRAPMQRSTSGTTAHVLNRQRNSKFTPGPVPSAAPDLARATRRYFLGTSFRKQAELPPYAKVAFTPLVSPCVT